MVTKKPSLGRGLGALLGQPVTTSRSDEPPASQRPDEQLLKLPVDLLQRGKYQPRLDMRTESLQELADLQIALLHRIPEASHMGMYEAPEKVIAAILSLVDVSQQGTFA